MYHLVDLWHCLNLPYLFNLWYLLNLISSQLDHMEWPKIEKEKMYLQWSFFRCWMVHCYEKIRIEQNYSQARQPLNKKCQYYSQIWTSVIHIQSCIWHWPYWKVKTTVTTTCNIPVIYRSPERSVMSHNFCCFISFGWISTRRVVNREIASSKPNPRSFKNKCSVHTLVSLTYSLFYFFTKRIFRDKNACTLHLFLKLRFGL